MVKVWNPRQADPFCFDLGSVDGPIMSGGFSPDWDMLLIGQITGCATLFTHHGTGSPLAFDIDANLSRRQSQDENPEDYRQPARELIASGEVVRRDGSWWGRDPPLFTGRIEYLRG